MEMEIKNKHVLFLVCVLLSSLVSIRIFYTFKTGFILPDEGIYFWSLKQTFKTGKLTFSYSTRQMYQLLLITFNVLSGTNVYNYVMVTSFLNLIFAIGTIYLLYKTNNMWSILTVFFIPSFILYVPFALTETPSLFFGMLGLYYYKQNKLVKTAISWSIATAIREPYAIILLGITPFLFKKSRTKQTVIYVLIALITIGVFISTNYYGYLYYLIYNRQLRPPDYPTIEIPKNEGYTISPEYPRIFTLPERVFYSIRNFFIGTLIGWTPILGVYVLFETSRKRVIVSLLSFLAFYGTLLYSGTHTWFSTLGCVSAIIRFANCTVLAVSQIKITKKLFVSTVLSSLILGTLSLQLGIVTQNPFTPTFKETPWVRLSRIVNGKGKILVYGEPLSRLYLFVDDNVVCKLPINQTVFMKDLTKNWDSIYLYGEKHPNHYIALPEWYKKFINETNYTIVWEDEESYCYRLS